LGASLNATDYRGAMTFCALLRFNLRYYRRHSLLSVLCLLGICLGVGILIAVELINTAALSSFASTVGFLSGRATHSVLSGYGRINETEFVRIWTHPGVKAAAPVVEVMAATLETSGEPIRFLGIDPFLDADFRQLAPPGGDDSSITDFVAGEVPAIYLSGRFMKRHGLNSGDMLTVLTAGIEKKVKVLAGLPDVPDSSAGDNLAVMDIAAAQELFARPGYLDRIDIIARGDPDELQQNLPPGLRITDANSRKSTLAAMLYSFQLNLTAMSLMALFVGIFLIYNFSMFSVLSRREDMALLLTLGSDRKALVLAFFAESLALAAAGSLLGIVFGYLVAWFSIEKVSSTISELYVHLNVESVHLTLPVVLTGIAVGFMATLAGTALPALEVAVTPPIMGLKRQSIEDRAHGAKGLLLIAGLVFFLVALLCAYASRFSIFWGFASTFGMTLAFALVTPSALSPFTHHVGLWFKAVSGSLVGFLAARTIKASLSRTSIAVAALAVALSMTIGVDTMIHSFRNSVAAWLDGSLQGDLYISPATTKWDHPLPARLVEGLKSDSRVQGVERHSTYDVTVNGRPVKLRVVDGSVLKHFSRFKFLTGEKAPWDGLERGEVFISESLSYRLGLSAGSLVDLDTPEGKRSFSVVAVVRDYSSDQGTIHMDRLVYEAIWKDNRVQSVSLFLKPGISPDEVRGSIVREFPGLDRTIVSNTKMKEDIFVIFDKTFAPTATLKGVSLLVALLGVATALMAILLERSREITVLGYLGMTRKELGLMNVYQALLMGLAAFLISVGCGLVLTYIIVFAINYRSFGWSIDIYLDPLMFAKNFALTMLACLAAALYPTLRLTGSEKIAPLSED